MEKEIRKVPYKSLLSRFRNIENKNKKFLSLDKETQRREIAYDGLKLMLGTGLSNSTSWEYWSSNLKDPARSTKNAKQLQEFMLDERNLNNCQVCQRGLTMVSIIRLGNNISPSDYSIYDGDPTNVVGFSMDDMESMENVYEGFVFSRQVPHLSKSKSRLANILCNVIQNGNFVSLDFTDYIAKWNLEIQQ